MSLCGTARVRQVCAVCPKTQPTRSGPLEAANVQTPHVKMCCQARARPSLRCHSKVAPESPDGATCWADGTSVTSTVNTSHPSQHASTVMRNIDLHCGVVRVYFVFSIEIGSWVFLLVRILTSEFQMTHKPVIRGETGARAWRVCGLSKCENREEVLASERNNST